MKYLFFLNNLKVLLELLRIRNCLMGFFAVFLASALVYENPFNESIILAAASVFFIMGAGNMINDYFDFEIDRINQPSRPIPSKRISRNDTLMLSLALFFLGIALSKNINIYCFSLAIFNSLFLIFYGKYSKKLLLISNLGVSYLVASIFIFGALAPHGLNLAKEQLEILTILAASAFLITFSREIIKDVEDVEGDKERYAVTLATRFGKKRAWRIALFFALIAIFISTFPFFLSLSFFNLQIYGVFISIADLIFLVSLMMHPALSQRLMVLGMMIALGAFFLAKSFPFFTFFF